MEDREKPAREEEVGYFIEMSAGVGAGKKNETYPSSLGLQKSPITLSLFGSEV